MSSPTEEFFADLNQRGHEPLLERTEQTVRLDLREDGQTEHWRLMVRYGSVRVSRDQADAECVITATRDVFDRVVTGRTKPLAVWLRNEMTVEGPLYALLMLQRLLPSRPGAHDPRALAAPMMTDVVRGDAQAAGS